MAVLWQILLVLFFQLFLNAILITLLVYTKLALTKMSGNNLIIISKPGEEIVEFMPILMASNTSYILVMSDLYANASSLGFRFNYVCNHLESVKKCYFAPLRSINLREMQNKIINLCKKLHITHVFTYSKNNANILKYAISEAAHSAILSYNENENDEDVLTGQYLDMKSFNDFAMAMNSTREWPYPSRPFLYTLLDQIDFNYFLTMLSDRNLNFMCALSPFIEIDRKMTNGISSMRLINVFRRFHIPPKK